MFIFRFTSKNGISIKKKVWRCSFIYREALVNLVSNKQYPTLVQYGVSILNAIGHTNTSDECTRYP